MKLYILISIVNVISSAMTATGSYLTWLYLLANVSFYLILYNCYHEYRETENEETSLWQIIRGYLWLVYVCIGGALILFLLMKLGMNPFINEISNKMDLFEANVEQFGSQHYYPYCLSILLEDANEIVKMPFFNDKGILCGLYHEPHIITFMVFPALFFLYAYIDNLRKRVLLFLVWMLILLMTTSTMNIIAFIICCFILLSFNAFGRLLLFPLSAVLLFFLIYVGLENSDLFFIADKLQGGSMEYSLKTIEFAFTPKTILGSNILSTSFLQDSELTRRDVGYVVFVLNILFLILFVYNIIKTLKLNIYNKMIGLGILYFFLHSMKVAMVAYSLSMLTFMIFILSIVSQTQILDEEQ